MPFIRGQGHLSYSRPPHAKSSEFSRRLLSFSCLRKCLYKGLADFLCIPQETSLLNGMLSSREGGGFVFFVCFQFVLSELVRISRY